jgi:probable F420-dependent oxidoreductase
MKVRFAVSPHAGGLGHDELVAFAVAIQDHGFDGVWLSDLPVAPTLDPLLALALIAGVTDRLHLGANIVPLGRSPFVLAKSLAQLDQLSGGRLLLSFVTGLGRREERDALALDGAARGTILEEVLGLVRAWWAGETVTHISERWSFTELPSAARPAQDPLEVWLGGRGPKALDRVGRVADGWLGSLLTAAEAPGARDRIQAAAAAAGREVDPEHFGMSIAYARTEPGPVAFQNLVTLRPDIDPRAVLPVGRAGLRTLIDGYREAGLSKFVLRPAGAVTSWAAEAAWLSDAVLDLQT